MNEVDGWSIETDVAIVGFDNVPMAAFTAPPLTTVEQPTAEQGRRAAGMLLERIGGIARKRPRHAGFACQLIVRASTVKAASAARQL